MRMTLTIIGFLIALYAAIVALAWAFQGSLIYPAPPVRAHVPAGYESIAYTTQDGLTLAAGYRPPAPDTPTLIFFHGNGADWQSSADVTAPLARVGYGVLAAEYRGYGGNPGSPSEAGLYDDGRAAYAFLIGRGIPPEDIVLVGNSLGSGVATHVASEVEARALVLISPFDSLEATASRALRWLPVRALLRDRYDNRAKFAQIAMPVLILHGEADTLISLDQARALAEARPGTELVAYTGWGHELVFNPAIQERIAAFLSGEPTTSRTPWADRSRRDRGSARRGESGD